MKELCIIVWYEELGEKSCFMEKLWSYKYKSESAEWNS